MGNYTPRRLDQDEIAGLMKRGVKSVVDGDVAAAELILKRAVDARGGQPALMLGSTYDSFMLEELGLHGAALVRNGYEQARELGSTEVKRRLKRLPNRR